MLTTQRSLIRFFIACSLVAALALTPEATPVWAADQVVNDCSDDNELFWDLYAMESSGTGGTLTFNCGTATIVLTRDMPNIARSTTIDGGSTITLSGGNARRILVIQASLTLKNITLTRGYSNQGGLLLVDNGGSLEANNVVLANSRATDKGGALYVYPGMSATLTDVLVSSNSAMSATNTSLPENQGGGIYNDQGNLALADSILASNQAHSGGGIYNADGNATLNNVTLNGNTSSQTNLTGFPRGGGIYNARGVMALSQVALWFNSATAAGGGIYNDQDLMEMTDVTFAANSAFDGGGIYNFRGLATLTNVTFNGNSASPNFGIGGGIHNQSGSVTLINVTLSGNSALAGGGIAIIASPAATTALTNVTFSDNTASVAGGIYNRLGQVTLKNTLIAHGGSGVNCDGISSGGSFNLSDDGSCSFGAGRENIPLLLGPLADNGGFTQTHLPQPGSLAIDNASGADCPSTDQRGFTRAGQGVACDVGAVEVRQVLFTVYLPVVIR